MTTTTQNITNLPPMEIELNTPEIVLQATTNSEPVGTTIPLSQILHNWVGEVCEMYSAHGQDHSEFFIPSGVEHDPAYIAVKGIWVEQTGELMEMQFITFVYFGELD